MSRILSVLRSHFRGARATRGGEGRGWWFRIWLEQSCRWFWLEQRETPCLGSSLLCGTAACDLANTSFWQTLPAQNIRFSNAGILKQRRWDGEGGSVRGWSIKLDTVRKRVGLQPGKGFIGHSFVVCQHMKVSGLFSFFISQRLNTPFYHLTTTINKTVDGASIAFFAIQNDKLFHQRCAVFCLLLSGFQALVCPDFN